MTTNDVFVRYPVPALIYVFDHEIDLETATFEDLANRLQLEQKSLAQRQSHAFTVLRELEAKLKDEVDMVKAMQDTLADLKRQLQGQPANSGNSGKLSPEQVENFRTQARAREKQLEDEQRKVKNSATASKKLFKKISSLCHPDKTQGDRYLGEIFITAKLALEVDDEKALKQLLKQAKDYLSGNPKKNKLNALRLRTAETIQKLTEARNQKQSWENTFEAKLLEVQG